MLPAAIGPFKIERELGRGGMGVVYLAIDTNLDRPVAIKALPADLAADADRLARFQREAKLLASLNHPNVGGIYGVESADGQKYLVLEFIDGATLAELLKDGAMPVDEALSVAKQIADAVEAAHEKGVIHRDLKPGNVMVTADGVVKVLDFGLARTEEGSGSSISRPGLPNSPTLTSPAPVHSPTIPGAIMGTAGYMSPEQARGKAVDKRSDIFSFGCVFFEMLTGDGPFPGETATDSIGAILHRDPDWARLPQQTPPRMRELLRHCLAKERRSRLHDIGDARLEIERAIAGAEWRAGVAPSSATGGRSRTAISVVAALALVAAGWALAKLVTRRAPIAPSPTYHVSAALPASPPFGGLLGIAPDGRFLVCRSWPELPPESVTPTGSLMIRRLDRDETKPIEGTAGARSASLSPDGRWLAFVAAKDRAASRFALKRIALVGGEPAGLPEVICELERNPVDICWTSEQEIALASSWESSILTVPASGGEPKVALRDEDAKSIDFWGSLRPLPKAKLALATRWSLVGQTLKERVELVDLASGKRSVLLPNAALGEYVADADGGMLLARRANATLVAVPFDLSSLELTGTPATVWSGHPVDAFALSTNGVLALATRATDVSGRRLAFVDEHGQRQPVAGAPRAFSNAVVSPDGGRALTNLEYPSAAELPAELWIHDIARGTISRLPTRGIPVEAGVWSNDGQRVAYGVISESETAIWSQRVDGADDAVKLYSVPGNRSLLIAKDWSPDGEAIAFVQVDLAGGSVVASILESKAGAKDWTARPVGGSTGIADEPMFSPDGKWMRFVSNESGRPELYVQRRAGAAEAKSRAVQVSTSGAGGRSWWSPDGKELRYLDLNDHVMSVQIKTEPTFSASLPKMLYSVEDLRTAGRCFAPDGRLFVILEGDNERPTKIDVVVNFLSELRAKLSAAQ
ncbi:MAG: protein kinase [Phycisphaerales bacterium]